MTWERLRLGRQGEEAALKALEDRGYQCLARNFSCPLGEIDLVARDGDTLVFVEIKTRKGRSIGYAKEAVNARKKRQLSKAALAYMKANDCWGTRARFDVVALHCGPGGEEIEIIKNAFDLAY